MTIDRKTIFVFSIAAALRLAVFIGFPVVPDFLTTRVEISTPVTSYKRLKEGIFLHQYGLSPYDGGVFHQPPLLLSLFETLPAEIIFVLLDTISGLGLHSIAEHVTFTSPRAGKTDGNLLAAAYLFNPFTILSCLGRSTNLLTNVTIIQAIANALNGNVVRAMFALAVSTYLALYPMLVLPPILLLCWQYHQKHVPKLSGWFFIIRHIFAFLAGLSILVFMTPFILGGSWSFMKSTYGVQITIPDLTPNVGLWWYFFIEIFDPFRDFFIGVFWLLLVSFVGSLTIRLQQQPLLVTVTLLGLITIFKPYPSMSDVSLYLAFLPLYQHLIPCKITPALLHKS